MEVCLWLVIVIGHPMSNAMPESIFRGRVLTKPLSGKGLPGDQVFLTVVVGALKPYHYEKVYQNETGRNEE